MGKGARLRAQRKVEGTPPVRRRPAVEVDPPALAKEKRKRRRDAFKEWRKLPREVRRAAAGKGSTEENTDD